MKWFALAKALLLCGACAQDDSEDRRASEDSVKSFTDAPSYHSSSSSDVTAHRTNLVSSSPVTEAFVALCSRGFRALAPESSQDFKVYTYGLCGDGKTAATIITCAYRQVARDHKNLSCDQSGNLEIDGSKASSSIFRCIDEQELKAPIGGC